VIVPSNMYIATWLAISQAGASIVPVEPDPVTLNIDPKRIPAALTDRTCDLRNLGLDPLPSQGEAI
jgi:dTDP-4-amino-4,6-dideoxygalactose transaminase